MMKQSIPSHIAFQRFSVSASADPNPVEQMQRQNEWKSICKWRPCGPRFMR